MMRELLATEAAAFAVVYRATVADGREAELRLRTDPESATLADAWARLSACYGQVDPRSIEIELRELPAREAKRRCRPRLVVVG
jgi:hypothetical protein